MRRKLENWIDGSGLSMTQILAIALVVGACMMSVVGVSGSYAVSQYMKYKTYELAACVWNIKVDVGKSKPTDFEEVKKCASNYNEYSLPLLRIDASELAR